MLNAEKEIRLLHAVVFLGCKETHILNVSLSALSTQSVQIPLHVFSRNARILVLEFVDKMLYVESEIIILAVFVTLVTMVTPSPPVKEQQVRISLTILVLFVSLIKLSSIKIFSL
mgnify:CR=1 FL=1